MLRQGNIFFALFFAVLLRTHIQGAQRKLYPLQVQSAENAPFLRPPELPDRDILISHPKWIFTFSF